MQAIISIVLSGGQCFPQRSKEIQSLSELHPLSRLAFILLFPILLSAHRSPCHLSSQPAPSSLIFRSYFDFIADRAFLHYPSSYAHTNALQPRYYLAQIDLLTRSYLYLALHIRCYLARIDLLVPTLPLRNLSFASDLTPVCS